MNQRSPTLEERETSKPRCGTCQRAIAPGTSSVAFPAHHARCIDRSLARARALHASWDM
jgi:hypothetical protein